MSDTTHTTDELQSSTPMDQYNTKEGVLKLGIIDPELEEVRQYRALLSNTYLLQTRS